MGMRLSLWKENRSYGPPGSFPCPCLCLSLQAGILLLLPTGNTLQRLLLHAGSPHRAQVPMSWAPSLKENESLGM